MNQSINLVPERVIQKFESPNGISKFNSVEYITMTVQPRTNEAFVLNDRLLLTNHRYIEKSLFISNPQLFNIKINRTVLDCFLTIHNMEFLDNNYLNNMGITSQQVGRIDFNTNPRSLEINLYLVDKSYKLLQNKLDSNNDISNIYLDFGNVLFSRQHTITDYSNVVYWESYKKNLNTFLSIRQFVISYI